MAIIETLTVELGSSIAKSILKVWLKDYSVASDIASDLLGLIKGKTQDVIAQQRAKRQFEAIGEKVAENLLPLFEAEKAGLDESTQVAIALRISAILNTSKIDATLLAEEDLEPSKLLSYLQNLHPERAKDFSKDESEFFERILSEVCQSVVDIASELPAFTERSLSEILKRENELIDKADSILEEVIRIRQSSERFDTTAQSSLFETEYRRAIVRKLDELELFGADVSRSSRRHRLSVAYVTLSVAEIIAHGEEKGENEDEEILDQFPDDQAKTVTVDKIVLAHPRLFIRGDAGSGKTTLLQWVAVRAASGTFEGSLAGLNEYTPFFIRLRQCVEKGLPAPQDFPELIVPSIADTMPKGWVHERLKSGKSIILIDGLDEVSQLKREEVRRWLRELVSNFPDVRYVLSSRPPAANEGWLAPEGFQDAMMQPMTLQDIFDFIDHWHAAVKDALEDEIEKEEVEHLATNLKNVIQNNRPIHNLATTPLLCAMISALHRDRRRQLPKDRIELYEACTYMLLERREIERQIDYSDYPSLTYRQKRAFLEGFAYWLMKNGWSSIDVDRLDGHFDTKLRNVEGLSKHIGKDIRRLFVERSGLLREPVKGIVHFAHRTFQEYLAAQAVLDEDDIGVLIKSAHDDQWREVVILASGLASQKIREDLIRRLIQRGDSDQRRRHQLHLLAMACLETSILLSPEVKQELETRLSKLTPPKNMTEAREWASAGELSIAYLAKGMQLRAIVAAACVRALSLIGGESALIALENFAKDTRQTVINELLRGLDYFDREDYSRYILSKNEAFAPHFRQVTSLKGLRYLTYLTELTIGTIPWIYFRNETGLSTIPDIVYSQPMRDAVITDLQPLTSLTQLTSLAILDCQNISSLEPLRNLVNLRELILGNINASTDLSPLGNIKGLERLELKGEFNDISVLVNLERVNRLNLADCKQLKNIEPLSKLINIETLNLDHCEQVFDLSPLANLLKVKAISLENCKQIDDLTPLAELNSLERLNLAGCERINDLSLIAKCEKLKSLNLSNCKDVKDISVLYKAKDLVQLSLVGCEKIKSFDVISGFPNLVYLNLAGCKQINDLKPFSKLRNLVILSLSLCDAINDIEPLGYLTKLRILDLGLCTSIVDISPLKKITTLRVLSLMGNSNIRKLVLDIPANNSVSVNVFGCRNLNADDLLETKNITAFSHAWMFYQNSQMSLFEPENRNIEVQKRLRYELQKMLDQDPKYVLNFQILNTINYRERSPFGHRTYYGVGNNGEADNPLRGVDLAHDLSYLLPPSEKIPF